MPRISIVATGVANTASVCAALRRLGGEPELVEQAPAIQEAELLVLPGVGSFGAAMATLVDQNWAELLRQRVAAGRPTLAICLGMQLLGVSSEEASELSGLGSIPQLAVPFPPGTRTPHMGWNRVEPDPNCSLLQPGAAYFAHSYCWASTPAGWAAAHTDYGGGFVAAVERGAVLACQFHPELSGDFGAGLLQRWLEKAGATC